MMDQASYLTDRLEDQLIWHDTKSLFHQKRFKRNKLLTILFSVLVPVGSTLIAFGIPYMEVVVGMLGALVAVLEGMSRIRHDQERYIHYRVVAESLTKEKMLFQTQSGPYRHAKPDAQFPLLVERVEELLSAENKLWQSMVTPER